MKLLFAIAVSISLMLSGCLSQETISSPSVSVTEEPETVEIYNDVPSFRGKPLLEAVQLSPDYEKYQTALRKWVGKGGKPYQFDRLMDASFSLSDILQMDPAEVEFTYSDGSVFKSLDSETQSTLISLGLEESVLNTFVDRDMTEFLLSLDEEQTEKLRSLSADLDANLEFMGLTHYRQTMMPSFEETIRTALAQPNEEEFYAQAEALDIPEWKQDALLKRGYLRSEILLMTEDEQDTALLPAATPEWASYYLCDYALRPIEQWSLTKEGYAYLETRAQETGISYSEIERLSYLGYTSYDTIMLSEEEWYFLFPLGALPDKLNQAGFSDEMIAQWEPRLKYLVQEAMEISAQS